MMARETDHMFNFAYEKTSAEILEKARQKIVALKAKIEERQVRIAALRAEHGIDDAALVQLLTAARQQARSHATMSYSYTSNAPGGSGGGSHMEERTIGAGVVNHLLTENDFIQSDLASVKRLDLVARNLRPLVHYSNAGNQYVSDGFRLTDEEIEFLGF